ncbi:glycosyltransferase [Nocardioides sp. MAHUQ-72]|uniref:glycosyltransferase n=1 Tax=unclassified Nocardioides TaxID=2615069 RepID=UPI003619D033
MIGDGSLRGWLRSRLPDAVFNGDLHTGHLAVALASLDLLVHPGAEEGCCHAVREAAASGVPVVAGRPDGGLSVVRHLETGLLHDPEDPRALARAVAAIAADPHRSLLGQRARELLTARTWRVAVDELVERHYRPLACREPRMALPA